MKIAYIFSVYKDFEYLAKILNMLNEPWADFYVHVDRKSKINIKKYQKENGLEFVNFLKNRMDVYWAGFTQIKSTLRLLEAVQKSDKQYDRIIFMSDGEFPLWSNQRIYDFFSDEKNKDKEFFHILLENDKESFLDIKRRFMYSFYDLYISRFFSREKYRQIMIKLIQMQMERGLVRKILPYNYYLGTAKFYITQNFMNYILDYVRLNPKDLNYFKYTSAIDEIFFVTMFMQSPYVKNLHNNLYRYCKWSHGTPLFVDSSYKEDIMREKPFIVAKLTENISDSLFNFLSTNRL